MLQEATGRSRHPHIGTLALPHPRSPQIARPRFFVPSLPFRGVLGFFLDVIECISRGALVRFPCSSYPKLTCDAQALCCPPVTRFNLICLTKKPRSNLNRVEGQRHWTTDHVGKADL